MARKESKRDRTAPQHTAARYLPEPLTLASAREAAASCRACELWKTGTQTVFGEGSSRARVMLVGEQPGNREDLEGHPFVGPAGAVLDRALEEAGIDRREDLRDQRGQALQVGAAREGRDCTRSRTARRSAPAAPGSRPRSSWSSRACWSALGATAAQALLGAEFRVSREHGRFVPSSLAPYVTATVHPSSILRQRTDEERERAMASFIDDLRRVRDVLDRD